MNGKSGNTNDRLVGRNGSNYPGSLLSPLHTFILCYPFAHVPAIVVLRRDLAVRTALLIGLGPRLQRKFEAAEKSRV